jgi:TolA-binding protein
VVPFSKHIFTLRTHLHIKSSFFIHTSLHLTTPPDLRPYFDELERFANGEMAAAEQEAFELRLENDPALAVAHAAYEQLTADLRWAAGHNTLRQRLQSLDERLNQRGEALQRIQRRTRRQKQRWMVLAGLGVLLLVAASIAAWWLNRPAAPPSSNWETYYQPDPGPAVTPAMRRSRPLLSEALDQYQAGHYPAALHSLGRVSPTKVNADTMLYLRGIVLLRQGQGVAAQTYLRRVSSAPGSELARRARYHLGMAYWQAEDLPTALTTLQQVAADSLNPYRRAARQVIQTRVLQVH